MATSGELVLKVVKYAETFIEPSSVNVHQTNFRDFFRPWVRFVTAFSCPETQQPQDRQSPEVSHYTPCCVTAKHSGWLHVTNNLYRYGCSDRCYAIYM